MPWPRSDATSPGRGSMAAAPRPPPARARRSRRRAGRPRPGSSAARQPSSIDEPQGRSVEAEPALTEAHRARGQRWLLAVAAIAAATRIASSASMSCRRWISAPSATASAAAASVACATLVAPHALLPGSGEHRADEVLAREREKDRPAEPAQLAEPPQDLERVVGAQVEVEAGVDRDLLPPHAELGRALDPLGEELEQPADDVGVVGRGAVTCAADPRCASARSRSRARRRPRASRRGRRRCR